MEKIEMDGTQDRNTLLRFKEEIAVFQKKLSSYSYEPNTREDFLDREYIETRLDTLSKFIDRQEVKMQKGTTTAFRPRKMKIWLKEFEVLRAKILEYFREVDHERNV